MMFRGFICAMCVMILSVGSYAQVGENLQGKDAVLETSENQSQQEVKGKQENVPKGEQEKTDTDAGNRTKDQKDEQRINTAEHIDHRALLRKAGGLLEIEEGDFLYSRIPEKKISQPVPSSSDEFVSDISSQTESLHDASQKKGLFGLSARATDYLAKGFLLFIVLLILILYRVRSRTRRNTVHKSLR